MTRLSYEIRYITGRETGALARGSNEGVFCNQPARCVLTLTDRLAQDVHAKLERLQRGSVKLPVLRLLLETAYLASQKTEEGRFVQGSLTFADPQRPNVNPPSLQRADYPLFTVFSRQIPFTVSRFVKLARAIDGWTGSVAVFGTGKGSIRMWGLVDELVQQNVMLNWEEVTGFENPGILTIRIDGVGDLSVYQAGVFLGGVRDQRWIRRDNDVLRFGLVSQRVGPSMEPFAEAIGRQLNGHSSDNVQKRLVSAWIRTVARLCIGIRRRNTGGALLITDQPMNQMLSGGYPMRYRRLSEAMVLQVLDAMYVAGVRKYERNLPELENVPADWVAKEKLAQTDVEDREREVTGAVKLVASLAGLDGVVVADTLLSLSGFGVKIGAGQKVSTVYDGRDYERKGTGASKVDLTGLGTRHVSVIRYCRSDPKALGIVVSQDGHVRVVGTVGHSLVLWDNVRLLNHEMFSEAVVRSTRQWQDQWRREKRVSRREKKGYTSMPKSLRSLLNRRR